MIVNNYEPLYPLYSLLNNYRAAGPLHSSGLTALGNVTPTLQNEFSKIFGFESHVCILLPLCLLFQREICASHVLGVLIEFKKKAQKYFKRQKTVASIGGCRCVIS